MKTRKKLVPVIVILVLAVAISIWLDWENKALGVTEITVTSEEIPESFSGYRIVHLSDLHNTEFGYENKNLIKRVKDAQPDIIVMTGDMVDMYRPKIKVALDLAEELVKISPVYFVTGNHDVKAVGREELLAGYEKIGVSVLRNKSVLIERGKDSMRLMGVDDPKFLDDKMTGNDRENTKKIIGLMTKNTDGFEILLAHRPEMIDIYSAFSIELVLSGHAHGGQINLPGKGGMLAPGQGWFPKYYKGLYAVGETQMVVSRGLGNSAFPFRVNNKPEIIVIELEVA